MQLDVVQTTEYWAFCSSSISSNLNSYLCSGSVLFVNLKKARPVLLNGFLRRGERLVPPMSLDLIMRVSFPSDSARTKVSILIFYHLCPPGLVMMYKYWICVVE